MEEIQVGATNENGQEQFAGRQKAGEEAEILDHEWEGLISSSFRIA